MTNAEIAFFLIFAICLLVPAIAVSVSPIAVNVLYSIVIWDWGKSNNYSHMCTAQWYWINWSLSALSIINLFCLDIVMSSRQFFAPVFLMMLFIWLDAFILWIIFIMGIDIITSTVNRTILTSAKITYTITKLIIST